MVLETIIENKKTRRSFWELFLFGILYSSVGVLLALWVFPEQSSLIMVFLTVLAVVPLMYTTIKHEERVSEVEKNEKRLFKSHGRALLLFMALFFGMLVAFSVWNIALPAEQTETLFSVQSATIKAINAGITEAAAGNSVSSNFFWSILANNVQVLAFCILFSFFFGAGAIFILTWNATVIAAAVGGFFRNAIASAAQAVGAQKVALYFGVFSASLLRYLTHGTFEILAYFVGGLAGSIISIMIIRHELYTTRTRKVIRDVAALVLIAIGLLVLGAAIEAYITPVIF